MRTLSFVALIALVVPACGSSSSKSDSGGGAAGAGGGGGSGAGGAAGSRMDAAAAGSGGAAGGAAGSGAAGAGGAVQRDGGATDAAAGGATGDGGMPSAAVVRGTYLVNTVLGCGGCHTPFMTGTTTADTTKAFSGRECFTDTMPPADNKMGCLHSANITPDKDTGIGNLTDQQVIDLFRTGKRPQTGDYLFSNMPYHQFSVLTDDDAKAIVAFLRAQPAISHRVPANEPPFDNRPKTPEVAGVPVADLPGTMPANGKYLAALLCLNCHTVDKANSNPKVVDQAKAYEGGRATAPVNNMMVNSENLTPDDTGIKGWTAADIVKAIKMGVDNKGGKLCNMRTSAITDADAMDIATYLLSLPPKNNATGMHCTMP